MRLFKSIFRVSFIEKINEATRRFVMLKTELQAYKDSVHASEKHAAQSSSRNLNKRRSAMFGALPLVSTI